ILVERIGEHDRRELKKDKERGYVSPEARKEITYKSLTDTTNLSLKQKHAETLLSETRAYEKLEPIKILDTINKLENPPALAPDLRAWNKWKSSLINDLEQCKSTKIIESLVRDINETKTKINQTTKAEKRQKLNKKLNNLIQTTQIMYNENPAFFHLVMKTHTYTTRLGLRKHSLQIPDEAKVLGFDRTNVQQSNEVIRDIIKEPWDAKYLVAKHCNSWTVDEHGVLKKPNPAAPPPETINVSLVEKNAKIKELAVINNQENAIVALSSKYLEDGELKPHDVLLSAKSISTLSPGKLNLAKVVQSFEKMATKEGLSFEMLMIKSLRLNNPTAKPKELQNDLNNILRVAGKDPIDIGDLIKKSHANFYERGKMIEVLYSSFNPDNRTQLTNQGTIAGANGSYWQSIPDPVGGAPNLNTLKQHHRLYLALYGDHQTARSAFSQAPFNALTGVGAPEPLNDNYLVGFDANKKNEIKKLFMTRKKLFTTGKVNTLFTNYGDNTHLNHNNLNVLLTGIQSQLDPAPGKISESCFTNFTERSKTIYDALIAGTHFVNDGANDGALTPIGKTYLMNEIKAGRISPSGKITQTGTTAYSGGNNLPITNPVGAINNDEGVEVMKKIIKQFIHQLRST
ncbi:hypothetical protein ACFLZV_05810, partial [Candidatus Margulisiibacteriota bacterium]